MEGYGDILKREEQVTLALRRMYEQYGYAKYRMGKFEEYDLYRENKNFLKEQSVITFNDLDGRVLALKPDVTLSIASHTHASEALSEKLYYLENVYRLDRSSRSWREIPQLGLEHIGRLSDYDTGEVLLLAMETLRAIGEPFRMQLSHQQFITALFDGLAADERERGALLRLIRERNAHELKARAGEMRLPPAAARLLCEAATLNGPFEETLRKARAIAITGGMNQALDRLEACRAMLAAAGLEEEVLLDFSLVNDEDYYSGLILQGFVDGVPRPVLTGGCYTNLMRRFGKPFDAVGFAVYVDELSYLYAPVRKKDADALVVYSEGEDAAALMKAVRALVEEGRRVRCLRRGGESLMTADKTYCFEKGALREVEENA